MIKIRLTHADLVRVRFAHSPVRELVASLRVMGDRSRHHVYRGWLSLFGGQVRHLNLARLTALVADVPYPPTFLLPSPDVTWGNLDDELDAVAATTPELVRAGLDRHRGRLAGGVLRPLYEDPAAHLPAVVDEMRQYWHAAIEPVWQRLRAVCTADVSYRADQFAIGGVAHVLQQLHPLVSFANDRLLVDDLQPGDRYIGLDGGGLLLIPCVFSWPAPTTHTAEQRGAAGIWRGAGQQWLTYPPRGVALPWQPLTTGQSAPLWALIGRTRATLLASLDLPATTTQLARQLNLSAAAISQHLQILKASGLAATRRRGRMVLYQRTATATALLTATGTNGKPVHRIVNHAVPGTVSIARRGFPVAAHDVR